MKRRKLTVRGILVIAAMIAATLGASGTATAAADEHEHERDEGERDEGDLAVPDIAWSSCYEFVADDLASFLPPDFGPPTFECGVAAVPLDYDQPDGATIDLALVRLPALDQTAKVGSMFINPGGPGGSGVDFAVFGAPFVFSKELRTSFDVVGFDPRGIARSTPLTCFGSIDEAFSIFQAPVIAFPKNAAEADLWAADNQRLADACAANGGPILGHMSTANVARDLDLLRAAVGDEQLTYYGISYGSYIGSTYANMFPENVRAMTIDGVLDPIAWSTGYDGQEELPFSTRLGSNIGAQETLEEFFRLCDDAGPAACALAPNASDRYAAIAQSLLDNEPVFIQLEVGPGIVIEFPFFYGDLIGMSLGGMYDSFGWPFLAMDLAMIEGTIAASGGGAPAPVADPGAALRLGWVDPAAPPQPYSNEVEGFPAVGCADTDNPDSIADWLDAAGDISFDDYFLPLWTFASSPCLSFPATDADRYAGPFDRETDTPVLVATTRYDPATPYHGAVAADQTLGNSVLVTVEGWGHATLGLSACSTALIDDYLLRQEVPDDGIVCDQDFNPFELFAGPGGGPGELQLRVAEARSYLYGLY